MKKVILYILILLVIFIPTCVNSLTIYGEYESYKTEVDEFIEESDTLKREEVLLFNTYEIVKKDLGYLDYCDNYDEYDFIDETIVTKEKLSNSFGYQAILPAGETLTYISLYDFKDVNVKEINIYYNGKPIEYEFSRNKEKFANLNDKDLNTSVTLSGNDTVSVYFNNNKFDPLNVLIEIIGDEIYVTGQFGFNNGKASLDKTRGNYIYFVSNDEYESLKEKYGTYNIQNTVSSYKNVKNYYKKNIRKYHCYKEEKVKTNKYVLDGENLIIDDFIKKYNYYIRSKNIIEDNVEKIDDIETVVENNDIVKNIFSTKEETKMKSKTTTKAKNLITNENNVGLENAQNSQEEIVKVEPLVNKINVKENKKFNYKYLFLIILVFFILHILLHCLHRKK